MMEQRANTAEADEGLEQKVSDLMDGRLTPQEASQMLDELGDAKLQETWSVYHLIGDVLRSQDLAACSGTTAFVERLRAQLPQAQQELSALPREDVVATDKRLQAANDPVFRWKMAAGVACFAVAALWGWSTWNEQGGPQGERTQLAQAVALTAAPHASAAPVQAVASNDDEAAPAMLRDARLDALLAAHWQSSRGASALGNAQGFLRGAAYEEAGR